MGHEATDQEELQRIQQSVTKAASSLEQRAYKPQLMKTVRVNLISVTTA